MEYLVTMTTKVPAGTSEESIDEIRAREAVRSRELAAQGNLIRLWRPPLKPGEWRTLGLFAAGSAGELEQVLSSMPLRVWRTDEVTPLSPHPHDPCLSEGSTGPTKRGSRVDFLTTFDVTVPAGTSAQPIDDTRARSLAEEGYLLRLWALAAEPDEIKTLGLWQAQDMFEMQRILESLPEELWLNTRTLPLTPHPDDPALTFG